jgi:hypothetical protein
MAETLREGDSRGDKTRHSRRQLLAGAAGALGAIAAEALVKATAVQATQGQDLFAGVYNSEDATTIIENTGSLPFGFDGLEVRGRGDSGTGVKGVAGGGSGTGVVGTGGYPFGTGVIGSAATAGIGVAGSGDIGVEGVPTSGTPNRLGVRGRADTVSGGTGVIGLALDGSGVVGKSISGSGVYGVAGTYTGAAGSGAVVGDSTTSAGVVGFTSAASRAAAEFTHVAGKTALKVTGLSVFSRSGKVAIKNTAKAATVTGVPLTASSLILATVQNSLGVWVASAVPNVPGSSFTINLNAAPGTGHTAQVAWFVVN